ncbi:MAG: flippase-like domain-containing protein [Chloroflexi bacterium]|nr:flippase-like domain-containing protein [Chloroflexota bacterium]
MRSALKYLAAVFVMVFWVAYVWRDWESFASLSWQMNPTYLLTAFAFYAGFYLVMGTGWALTLRAMAPHIDFAAALHIWLVSTPARYLPGAGWHIAGRAYLGSRIGITSKDLLVSMYLEQALAVMSGLVVFTVSVLIGGGVLDRFNFYLLILIPVGIAMTHPRGLQLLANLASRALKKKPIDIELRYSQVLALLIWFAFSHVLSGVSLFLVLASISPSPLRLLPSIIGASALAWVVGVLSILTPGGIGVREATVVALSSTFVAAPAITTAAFVTRFLSALAEAFLAVMSTVLSRRLQFHSRGGG